MQLTPTITLHMTAALAALAIGPVALWARLGARQRPMLHRAAGYAWVTLMVVAAVSALFIRDYALPNIGGYTPIHLLVPYTLLSLVGAFRALARRDYASHRSIMQKTYIGACVVAGAFTLLPGRYLGQLVWGQFPFALQVITSTPLWVWGLLAGLVALGVSQSRDREAGLARVTLPSLALVIFSVAGLVSDFGASVPVLLIWAVPAAGALVAMARGQAPAGTRFDAARQVFVLPGSWVPMGLILGIFLVKYAVGVSLNLSPALRSDAVFVFAVAALSGALSGALAGRVARLLRLHPGTGRLTLQRDPW